MRLSVRFAVLLAGVGLSAIGSAAQQPFDILVVNGRVLDGSGNPWLRSDVGIRGDRIVALGRLTGAASVVIDAADRVVAPGFIDVHSHALETITRPELRDAKALVAQGVTTIVGNPDGGGPVDLKQQAAALENGGLGVNAALLIGHASVRNAAMGQSQQREPTPAELDRMRAMIQQAVADGAFGLSSGLFYAPGRFSKTDEVIALAKVAGGVYTSHIRDEGDYDYGVVQSVDEVIRIGEEAGVRGVVTHMKALGPDNWGKTTTMIAHIEAARARGVQVFADQYPYDASSTGLAAAVLPGVDTASAKRAMSADATRERLLATARESIRKRGGAKSIVIASFREEPALNGKTLEDIGKIKGTAPERAAVDMILAGGGSIISFNMSKADIEAVMRQPWTMASSDGGLALPGPAVPHPRNNGAFARRLGVYVRERRVLSLEQAVRAMTSLPAQVFGLGGRGELRDGAFADLVIFNPANVIDRATYDNPHELAAGLDWVIVNGRIARREGQFTAVLSGRVLKRTAQ